MAQTVIKLGKNSRIIDIKEKETQQIDFCPVCYAPIFDDESYVLYDGRCYCPACWGEIDHTDDTQKAEYHKGDF